VRFDALAGLEPASWYKGPSVIPLVIPPGTTRCDRGVPAGWHIRPDQ